MNILAGLGTMIIGFWLRKASRNYAQANGKLQRVDKTLAPILASIRRYAGFILTLVVALGQFGVQTTSIIAVLGAAGLAIGLPCRAPYQMLHQVSCCCCCVLLA